MAAPIDHARLGEFVERSQSVLTGAATALMVHLGDRLGLYRHLADGGPATDTEIAARAGCDARYLREWLAQQASAGVVAYDEETGRFELPSEHALVLTNDESPAGLAGAFEFNVGWYLDVDAIEEIFRTGEGMAWGEHDERVHRGTARFFGAAYHGYLLNQWVPALGLHDVLSDGAKVADVGCGLGVTTALLASAYPASTFVAVDVHPPSIAGARGRCDAAGVGERVEFEIADATSYREGPYDVIWFFDAFHDLGDPVAAARYAREQLAPGGVVALVEPFAHDDPAENITSNPVASLSYTASTCLCVPNATSQPGDWTLGAQAGGRKLAEVLGEGGLGEVQQVTTTPIHAVYAARP